MSYDRRKSRLLPRIFYIRMDDLIARFLHLFGLRGVL